MNFIFTFLNFISFILNDQRIILKVPTQKLPGQIYPNLTKSDKIRQTQTDSDQIYQ